MRDLYIESKEVGRCYRERQLEQIIKLIISKRNESNKVRKEYLNYNFSCISHYEESTITFRKDLVNMLGWPLTTYNGNMESPNATMEFVSEDELGTIFRVNIEILDGIDTYGLLFLPKAEEPYNLVVALHGKEGTPEICSSFFDSSNYNEMVRRIRKKNVAVFVPQLMLWNEEFGPKIDNYQIDLQLKQIGGSLAALEIFKIMRSIDYLIAREDIKSEEIGMIGLSYGGFYTLYTTAIDNRIKSALSSCFFNDRFIYDWSDWTWFKSGNMFLDEDICSLICPRHLWIEIANNDFVFSNKNAEPHKQQVIDTYSKLNIGDRFVFKAFDGEHEFNKSDDGIDFVCSNLR